MHVKREESRFTPHRLPSRLCKLQFDASWQEVWSVHNDWDHFVGHVMPHVPFYRPSWQNTLVHQLLPLYFAYFVYNVQTNGSEFDSFMAEWC